MITASWKTKNRGNQNAFHTGVSNNTVPMTRRDFFKLIGAHIATLTVLSTGCSSSNDPGNDVSTAPTSPEIPADALLEEYGSPLLAENGEYLVTG